MDENYIFNIVRTENERIEGEKLKYRVVFEENYWADITYNNGEMLVAPGSDEKSDDIEEMIFNLNENVGKLASELKERHYHLAARLMN